LHQTGLPKLESLQQPCDSQFADFFLAELPHVFSAADQIAVAPYDDGNHIPANVAFVDFSFLSHDLLLSSGFPFVRPAL
jgi:hypothetical protein